MYHKNDGQRKRSLMRAILFIIRIQKIVTRKTNDRQQSTSSIRLYRSKCGSKSTRLFRPTSATDTCRPPSDSRRLAIHRNSAPINPTFCLSADERSTSVPIDDDAEFGCYEPIDERHQFAQYTLMSRPYSVGLVNNGTMWTSGGRSSSNRIGIASSHSHRLASAALLRRQASINVTGSSGDITGVNRPRLRRHRTRDDDDSIKQSSSSTIDNISTTSSIVMSGSMQTKGIALNGRDRKRMSKLNDHLRTSLAAFTAVEQDDIGTIKSMLTKSIVDVNQENMDDWSLLDVALMLNHCHIARLLLEYGAVENSTQFTSIDSRLNSIQTVLDRAQTRLAELNVAVQSSSSQQQKEIEIQLNACESRVHQLKKMKANVENPHRPNAPRNVTVQVGSSQSLIVTFEPPAAVIQPSTVDVVITKYRVEWSERETFDVIDGTKVLYDLRKLEVTINELTHGRTYSVRVAAAGLWGFGDTMTARPLRIAVTSWEDVDNASSTNNDDQLADMSRLYQQLTEFRQTTVWEQIFPTNGDQTAAMKKKRTSLRNLFSAGNKFQKSFNKGIYLTSVIYADDKILVTVDDGQLPVIAVDDTISALSSADINWLMKLSCAWDETPLLQTTNDADMSNSLHIRNRLLDAITQMQSAVGLRDIGRLHYQPIVDQSNGVQFLVTVAYVGDMRSVQGLAVKWIPISKLLSKRKVSTNTNGTNGIVVGNAMDLLLNRLLSILNFYESSHIPLDRGLYLCYMKMHSSVNEISIVAPENLPSVLPFVCLRSNPHVSQEEWQWLKLLDTNRAADIRPSAVQLALHWSLVSAARMLLGDLDVDADQIRAHRLYTLQVISIHPDVSLILIVPRLEDVCSAPTTFAVSEEKRGCLSLPVPVFEMAHLCTYQPDFITIYCRLSSFIEHYSLVVQQLMRNSLLDADIRIYRELLDRLAVIQQSAEQTWRSARWVTATASSARDKQLNCGLPLSILFAYSDTIGGGSRQPSDQSDVGEDGCSDVGYHSDQSSDRPPHHQRSVEFEGGASRPRFWSSRAGDHHHLTTTTDRQQPLSPLVTNSTDASTVSDTELLIRPTPTRILHDDLSAIDRLFATADTKIRTPPPRRPNTASPTTSRTSTSAPVGIIRVYAAYACGLARGTSVRLQVGARTTSREVVALVVQQLSKAAAVGNNGDNTMVVDSDEFCLVAVIGARERCLRDDFAPLQLQNPWAKGRLFVRRRDNLLAALEYGNEACV